MAGEDLAIGISDNGINLLCKLGPESITQEEKLDNSDFDDTLEKVHIAQQSKEEVHA